MRNYLIENVYFERYGEEGIAVRKVILSNIEYLNLIYVYADIISTWLMCSSQLRFENPKGYCSQKTSYVYIMCPWISKWVSCRKGVMRIVSCLYCYEKKSRTLSSYLH